MRRREFLLGAGVGAAQLQVPAPPDSQTNALGLEYFLLGNGRITVGVQSAPVGEAGAHCGLLVMSPDHMNRKTGSLLWHPRTGLQSTRCTLWVDGKPYMPEPGQAKIEWTYPGSIPTVRVSWDAAGYAISEELWCPIGQAALLRNVIVENRTGASAELRLSATLRPNPMFFDEYDVDREQSRLSADGYHHIAMYSLDQARVLEREVEITLGKLSAGARAAGRFVLALDSPAITADEAAMRRETAAYWSGTSSVHSGDAGLDHLFRTAQHGFRAIVARSGKMDGGIWQYNLEWVRDASMVAEGATMAGLPDMGEAILDRILTRMVSDNGAALDSSFHRPPETIELDQNGQLIHSLWTHWAWTGRDVLIRKHWKRIKATADFVLRPEFRDARTGLVRNSREFWERGPSHGVRDGYESAYQAWNIAGWPMAAEMAQRMSDPDSAARWRIAAELMKKSFLSDPDFAFVKDQRLIKRRLADGRWHETMEPPNREALAVGMPLRVEKVSYCDPDAASVFPILLGFVDANSEVSRKTLESMETLWNQRWPAGGYGRYHVTGEPDSPGPWPFATLFIARAYLEAGNSEKVWRALRWLASVPGGKSGAWFEFYGERPSPPLPQVAIIPWIWAEIVALTVGGILGVRPTPTDLVVRPKLLDGLAEMKARLRINGHDVLLTVARGSGQAKVNGQPIAMSGGALKIARPEEHMEIEVLI